MRLILILCLMLALAPGTWLRSDIPSPNPDGPVILTRLGLLPASAGDVQVLGGWKMVSENQHFGGYSALLAIDDQHLIAASDRGRVMWLTTDGDTPAAEKLDFLGAEAEPDKRLTDVESMTRDPATGKFWIAYEGVNAIERLNPQLAQPERAWPAQMQEWSTNKGAEAMARLADGQFIVLSEGSGGWGSEKFPGLRFPSDPVANSASAVVADGFSFVPPTGYRPVDMVQIPDGRVLILVRRVHWEVMPRFTTKLVVADPAKITSGEAWSGTLIAEFKPPLPSDNYEGLAMWPREDGLLDLWMISDDNNAGFQSTYLLHMRWDPQISSATVSSQ